MKTLLLISLLALAGCQSPKPAAGAPAVPPPRKAEDVIPASDAILERKLRRQTQLVEALMSQNEALQAQFKSAPPLPAVVKTPPSIMDPVHDSPRVENTAGMLAPNADGLIDLTAAATPEAEPNPFAVRKVPGEAAREVPLHLAGIVTGEKPCAVINERLVKPGDGIEGFIVARIEPGAVVLEIQGQRLRLPLAEKPVRVRLAP